ncbi:MAG: alpha-L-fucosidase [Phycisphaerales bacterium]|nr:alpha-L-fucosidase [Phycisphaerales bacterium]
MPSLTRVALALLLTSTALAQPDPGAPPQAIDAWRARRFGMFIHWGPVALTGREIGWSRGRPTPIDEYDHLYQRFNPTSFDAAAWAALADDAGARYLVLTTKHHDGFCLWPSDSTDYDIASSPFHRDPVAELAAACRAQGLAFGAYYSVPDWHHPDYPKGSPHGETDKPDPHPDRYADYLRDQVTELATRYGHLCTLWFDMPREFGPDQGLPTVAMLRKLQPDIVINDRAFTPDSTTTTVGDYATPEQRIGGFDRSRPWESCITMGRSKGADQPPSTSAPAPPGRHLRSALGPRPRARHLRPRAPFKPGPGLHLPRKHGQPLHLPLARDGAPPPPSSPACPRPAATSRSIRATTGSR